MALRAAHIKHYRSIQATSVSPCAEFNVLIGKNNAGKSNILSAIELVFLHLQTGRVSGPLRVSRPQECFTDRDDTTSFQIGIEFDLPTETNEGLRKQLVKEAAHLERAVEQIKQHNTVYFVLEGASERNQSYLFVQYIGIGRLRSEGNNFVYDGIKLLSLTSGVAFELYKNVTSADSLRSDVRTIEEIRSGSNVPLRYVFDQVKSTGGRGLLGFPFGRSLGNELREQIESRAKSSSSLEEFQEGLAQVISETQEKVDAFEKREIDGEISAFAGGTRTQPVYAKWLMEQFGSTPLLHIRERKEPIGRQEAETFLQLKVRRKGPDKLLAIQATIRALLGVNVDAFQSERRGDSSAELDVDDFIVEANGAGIREALRLILDLELKPPKIVLIEEPEVHLHPGMARIVADYLRRRSRDIQVFLTTHSTDFVDAVSFQSVFLISRDAQNRTLCETVRADEGPAKISAELGLRYSTVFMYDRLAFVEGPSDEAVFREFASKLNIDLARSNVGFVHMMGVRNFAHYASEATMDLLSRRQIRIWFVADRDENDDQGVQRMIGRLGDRATLKVLERRELENYLLVPSAVKRFIEEKLRLACKDKVEVNLQQVQESLEKEAVALKEEVVRLRVERRLLTSVFLQTRATAGTIAERLERATAELSARAGRIDAETQAVKQELEQVWPQRALEIVPGSCYWKKSPRISESRIHLRRATRSAWLVS